MGAPLIKDYKILVGGSWASHRSRSRVADGTSAQRVVRTQNISGSLLQNDRYIVLLYFVFKSDFSSWPNLNRYCLKLALRADEQHSASETQYDFERVLPMAAGLTLAPLLVRADSGFCSLKLMRENHCTDRQA
jgi:hypothetical protein